MKPKRDKPPEIAPQPPEDAKMTGRKGAIKKAGKDMGTTKPSGPEGHKASSEALHERKDVTERDTDRG